MQISVSYFAFFRFEQKLSALLTIMELFRPVCFVTGCRMLSLNFSSSSSAYNKWRLQQGLEREPRQFGPLTNLRDYSFVDGRPVPLSYKKLKKVLLQQQYCKKIVELSHELNAGLEMYYQRLEAEKKQKEEILKRKLKPKGASLLANNKDHSVSKS